MMTVIDSSYFTSQPDGSSPSVDVKIFGADSSPPNSKPAVVVAYGTAGLSAPFGELIDQQFCEVIAAAGYVVVRPDYFMASSTPHEPTAVLELLAFKKQDWVKAIADAVEWIPTMSFGVNRNRIALVGFSLGANLVIQANAQSGVKAVVDFFGPIKGLPLSIITDSVLDKLPMTQIHHGKNDAYPKGVAYSESVDLSNYLGSKNISADFHPYDNQGHPGQFPGSWTTSTQSVATANTISFLDANV